MKIASQLAVASAPVAIRTAFIIADETSGQDSGVAARISAQMLDDWAGRR
jgi:hypothetical protein